MYKYFQLIEIFSAKLLGNQILKTYAYINKGIGTYNIYVYVCMCVCMYEGETERERKRNSWDSKVAEGNNVLC